MNPQADAQRALRTWVREGLDGARGTAQFSPQLPVFLGHFPEQPLVPGVHQLALLVEVLRAVFAQPELSLHAISRAKWLLPVYPGDELAVQVRWQQSESGLLVAGECRLGERLATSCRLTVRAG